MRERYLPTVYTTFGYNDGSASRYRQLQGLHCGSEQEALALGEGLLKLAIERRGRCDGSEYFLAVEKIYMF
jgi:hypothetical protein